MKRYGPRNLEGVMILNRDVTQLQQCTICRGVILAIISYCHANRKSVSNCRQVILSVLIYIEFSNRCWLSGKTILLKAVIFRLRIINSTLESKCV